MGKGNAAVKQWLGNPRRFADLFNGIVFQGKQVILPEDLHLATGETDILVIRQKQKSKRGTTVSGYHHAMGTGGIPGAIGM